MLQGSVDVFKKLVKSETTIDEKTGKLKKHPKPESDKYEAFICGQYVFS